MMLLTDSTLLLQVTPVILPQHRPQPHTAYITDSGKIVLYRETMPTRLFTDPYNMRFYKELFSNTELCSNTNIVLMFPDTIGQGNIRSLLKMGINAEIDSSHMFRV
ncbi:hypothetical protein C1N27_07355 [Vibrio diazotrophicus]|nr:hypothetical protein C1N27_07355 [Vibrio diazotrophicus]